MEDLRGADGISAKGDFLNRMAGTKTDMERSRAAADTPKKGLDKDAFLKIFMEQLKYQDPMNPVKDAEFGQQVATMAQLEQNMIFNKNMEGMIKEMQGSVNGKLQAMGLVGKNVMADLSVLNHLQGASTAFEFDLPKGAKSGKVEISAPTGELLATMDLGQRESGAAKMRWDGMTTDGAPVASGRYAYKVTGVNKDGQPIDISNKVEGTVDGVTTQNGQVMLLVGNQKVSLTDIDTIRNAPAGESKTGTNIKIPSGIENAISNTATKESAAATEKPTQAPELTVNEEAEAELSDDRLRRDLSDPLSLGSIGF